MDDSAEISSDDDTIPKTVKAKATKKATNTKKPTTKVAKRKLELPVEKADLKDMQSPPKKKAKTPNEEIFSHHLGKFIAML